MFEDDNKPSFLTVGTPQCAAFCSILVLVFAVLLLTVGFWKMLLLGIFALVGLFIGGVKDKERFLQEKLSALIPSGEKKPYRATAYPAGTLAKRSAPADDAADEDGEAGDAPDEEPDEESDEEPDEEEDVEEESPEEEAAPEAEEAGDDGEAEDEEASGEDGETSWKAGPETGDGRVESAGENR